MPRRPTGAEQYDDPEHSPSYPHKALVHAVATSLGLDAKTERTLGERSWRVAAHVRQPRADEKTCNKTPFFERWDTDPKRSYLRQEDPRYASESVCKRIHQAILSMAFEATGATSPSQATAKLAEDVLGRTLTADSLKCVYTGQHISTAEIRAAISVSSRLASYEIPIGYRLELNEGGNHTVANVGWMKPFSVNWAMRSILRNDLTQKGVPRAAIDNVIGKIAVKAYLTDKVTMPPHFSNRDYRWATWPKSIQYASRFASAGVELELLSQLYEFDGAPALSKNLEQDIASVRGREARPGTRVCIVTGSPLRFDGFVEAAKSPEGGKSGYHVGHLVPLTRRGRHSADNIAWLSEAGNRIQGNDTLDEIETTLRRATAFHIMRDVASGATLDEGDLRAIWGSINAARARLGLREAPW